MWGGEWTKNFLLRGFVERSRANLFMFTTSKPFGNENFSVDILGKASKHRRHLEENAWTFAHGASNGT